MGGTPERSRPGHGPTPRPAWLARFSSSPPRLSAWACSSGTIWASSATYDEVAYLRVAARWWRTGDQAEITRMGSPLTFWKLQQVPVLWVLDRLGRGALIDDPIGRQAELLPLVRPGRSGSGSRRSALDGRLEPAALRRRARWPWRPGSSP